MNCAEIETHEHRGDFREWMSITEPPETWNRVGTKPLPKLKNEKEFKVEVGFSVTVDAAAAAHLKTEIQQILQALGMADKLTIEVEL